MTFSQFELIFDVMQKKANTTLPFNIAWKVYSFNKKYTTQHDFYVQSVRDLISKYHGNLGNDSQLQFSNAEDLNGFNAGAISLGNTECDCEFNGFSFDELKYFGDIEPNVIALLIEKDDSEISSPEANQ